MKRYAGFFLILLVPLALLVLLATINQQQAVRPSSSPSAPAIPLGQNGSGIQVRGDLAYVSGSVAYGIHAIVIYDISDPLSPQQLSVISEPGGRWEEFDVVEDRLYAFEQRYASSAQGMDESMFEGIVHIFDVSNPTKPVEVAQFRGPGYYGFGMPIVIRASADNRYLYLNDANSYYISIYDISDLSNPQLVSTYGNEWDNSVDLKLVGNRAYIKTYESDASEHFAIAIYDVSDPKDPVLISDEGLQKLTQGTSAHFSVWDNMLYASKSNKVDFERSCSIQVIDVSDTLHPILEGEIDKCGGNFKNENGLFYFSAANEEFFGWGELWVYDVEDPASPSPLLSYSTKPGFRSFGPFDLYGSCVIINRGGGGSLHVFCSDTHDKVAPTPTATATSTPVSTPTATATSPAVITPTVTPTVTATQSPTPVSLFMPLLRQD